MMNELKAAAYDEWLWGKKEPFCSLVTHMIAVGACVVEYLCAPSSEGILRNICRWMGLSSDEAVVLVAYVAALHDIGKAHPAFQGREEDKQQGYWMPMFRHEQYGADLLRRQIWKEQNWDEDAAGFFAAVVRLHHQGKGSRETRRPVQEPYPEIQRDLEKRIGALFPHAIPHAAMGNADALGVLLTGILILCDWVASSERFSAETIPAPDDATMLTLLRERARTILKQFGLIADAGAAFPRRTAFTDLWPAIPREGMRPLQRVSEELCAEKAMLTIIEAPMGEGKTETALYLAGRLCEQFEKRGVYMALPTAATSNQMLVRVRAMLEAQGSGSVRLTHGMAWLVDDNTLAQTEFHSEDALAAAEWLRPLRRAMLSENAVGTVDQAMAAALRIKYGFLRLAGLAGKVLIIDEIHAYDIFMSTIIARLLEWCRALGIPAILLSATMQNRQKQLYLRSFGVAETDTLVQAYPLITQVTEKGEIRQTPVPDVCMRSRFHFYTATLGADSKRIAGLAQERAANGGCVCVMLNTVRQAQAVYRELRTRGEEQVMLFHARFTAERRAQIEKTCVELFGKDGERPERMILVCTQVVEQSLDVDFDAMITQLAPMDLLLQRAGRVHRHAGRRRPAALRELVIDVIVPEETAPKELEKRYWNIGGVYPPIVMRNTEELLGGGREISVPEDVRGCVERAYSGVSGDEIGALIRQQTEDRLKTYKAEEQTLRAPRQNTFLGQTPNLALSLDLEDADEVMFVSGAHTRDGSASQQILFLPRDFPENDGSREWMKRAMKKMCSVPLTRQIEAGMLKPREGVGIKGKFEKIEISREDGQGVYHWKGHLFTVSDEYGIEEVLG